jgi:hypothetical protein
MQLPRQRRDVDHEAEAIKQLGRSRDDPEIATIVAALGAPLHPNCYLSPTQFAQKFGTPDKPHHRTTKCP